MAIKCAVTSKIKAALDAVCGVDAIDVNTLSFYETICINQMPLNQSGRIFDKAVVSTSFMTGMVDYLQNGGAVPLHTLHAQGYELPMGKVILAELVEDEVRAIFYVPNSETDIIAKLDTGVINEVSIGAMAEKMLCSECGFDYLSEEATLSNLWSQTCDKDHTVGEKGVHLRLVGLKSWNELSLVSKGAANGAKILPRAKQVLSADEYGRLAATGKPAEAIYLTAHMTPQNKGNDDMDNKELIAQLAQKTAELAVAELKLTQAEDKAAQLTLELTTAKAAAAPDAETQAKAATDLAAAQATATAAKATADSALQFMQAEHNRMALLAGEAETTETDAVKLAEAIAGVRLRLSAKFPVVGALGLGSTPAEASVKPSVAFKSKQ